MSKQRPPTPEELKIALFLREAPSVIAAAMCYLARTQLTVKVADRHSGACVWCDYPTEVLIASVREATQSPEWDEIERAFEALPKKEQRRLTEEAQTN